MRPTKALLTLSAALAFTTGLSLRASAEPSYPFIQAQGTDTSKHSVLSLIFEKSTTTQIGACTLSLIDGTNSKTGDIESQLLVKSAEGFGNGHEATVAVTIPFDARFKTTYTIDERRQQVDSITYVFTKGSRRNPLAKVNEVAVYMKHGKLQALSILNEDRTAPTNDGRQVNCLMPERK